MTEAEYLALTAACDALLRAPEAGRERIAISWLHVRSEHPAYLLPYYDVFTPPPALTRVMRAFRRSATTLVTFARSWLRPDEGGACSRADFPKQIDILFLSHVVSEHADPDAPDFYFGHLPADLAARGYTSLVALQNHVGPRHRVLAQRWLRGGATARIVLPRRGTFGHEVSLARGLAREAARLWRLARHNADPMERAVTREAARHAVSPVTRAHLRIDRVVEDLCRRLRPRALFVTWEGHAWERLAFRAARSVDPSIRCVGYQHTILLPRSHALKRPLGSPYDPDVIMTVGDVTREVIARAPGMSRIPVITYGSHRTPEAPRSRLPDAGKRCLVIPEGLESECLTLFDFAIEAAARMPDLQLVLRTHPVLPFRRLASRHARLRQMPANVSVSDQPDMAADFARCDWALYRGSSVAVYAALAGVKPVYLACGKELIIDPLFALDGVRRVVTVEDFRAVIAADRAAGANGRPRDQDRVREFCERYVVPANTDVVEALLRQ